MKMYRWTLEIEVADIWVQDGFDIDDQRAQTIAQNILPHATGAEIRGRVVQAPPDAEVTKEMGYKDVEDRKKRDSRFAKRFK